MQADELLVTKENMVRYSNAGTYALPVFTE